MEMMICMEIITNKESKKDDKIVCEALFSQFIILMMQYVALRVFNVKGTSKEFIVIIPFIIIVGLFFIRALPIVLKRNGILFVLSYTFSIIIFCLHCLMFPNNIKHINSIIFSFFGICLPSFIYSYSIEDYDILYDTLRKVSYINFVLGVFVFYLIAFKNLNKGVYSMGFSYYFLLPCLFFIYEFFEKRTIKYFIFTLISILIILAVGSRGPILSIGIYIIIEIFNNFKKERLFTIFLVLLIGIVILIYFHEIALYLYEFLSKHGIYSRTLYLFLQEDDIHLSNRDYIYNSAINLILEHPTLGIGIAGDRYYFDTYAHNLFLEIMLDYGIIFGLIISIILIYIFLRSTFLLSKDKSFDFIKILFCIGIVPLMISSSYLTSAWFWIYIGITVKYLKFKKSRFNFKI